MVSIMGLSQDTLEIRMLKAYLQECVGIFAITGTLLSQARSLNW